MKTSRLLTALAVLPLFAAPLLANAADGEALFKSKPCVACHMVDSKLVGPALKDVAAKYADQEGAVELLAGHIKNGSSGVWGPVPMPPNAVTEEEAKALAEWVLSL
ncbi:c-type cytochrome [Marinobacter sp. X15-166B]|uniref:c-type cytochrome n=1 Tax=Marinobacter sp. X15-166B TaxID=1897620 RepID=UPI000B17AB39|nr:c-type cytochrome [Marinobacter sp. X15-166B]